VWDSKLHPFGLDVEHARIGSVCRGRNVSFEFDPSRLPAAVQVLDRVGDEHGMKVMIAWRGEACGDAAGGDEMVFNLRSEKAGVPAGDGGTGEPRLTAVGGGWVFENAHYRAQVSRTGILAGMWRKEGGAWQPVVRGSSLYTDKGFEGDKRMSQEDDVEAHARFERDGTALRLRFSGELRGFYRFDKMAHPLHFYSEYCFDDGPAFRRVCAFKPESFASAGYAFLSLLTKVEGFEHVTFADAAGAFVTGDRGAGKGRGAQTAKSTNPKRVPTEIRLANAKGTVLRMDDLSWVGLKPANIFLHGDDLHVAWMDGKPDNSGAGQWNGLSMSVSCGDGAMAPATALPGVQGVRTGVLQDGDFEAFETGSLGLLLSGRALTLGEKDLRTAWQLPKGAEVIRGSGNRCVTVEGDGLEYRMLRQPLAVPAFPAGSSWQLTARLKGKGIEKGDPEWKTACLRWGLFSGERFDFKTASLPLGDSDWHEVSVKMTVPAGLTALSVEAGMNGNKGRVWIDDVRVERK
jgi:hypothetical protein